MVRAERHRAWTVLICVTTLSSPQLASASFNLDSSTVGRIWAAKVEVDQGSLPSTKLVVAVDGLGNCPLPIAEHYFEPQERDCRFERQLVEALRMSGMFAQVMEQSSEAADADILLVPVRSRVQYTRSVIPAAKPFLVLSFFTYLWTPFPYEVDVESYDLAVLLRLPGGETLASVAWSGEFRHYLGAYSDEHRLPDDVSAELSSAATTFGHYGVCRGPHSSEAARELFRRIGAAVGDAAAATR